MPRAPCRPSSTWHCHGRGPSTLDPGVELKSVTATSLTGQLNCAVTDSTGATLVVQNTNTMIATCTK